MTGDKESVEAAIESFSQSREYRNPTETLPEPPPPSCSNSPCQDCIKCASLDGWWSKFKSTVDDLLLKSNVHKCSSNRNKDGSQNKAPSTKVVLIIFGKNVRQDFPGQFFQRLSYPVFSPSPSPSPTLPFSTHLRISDYLSTQLRSSLLHQYSFSIHSSCVILLFIFYRSPIFSRHLRSVHHSRPPPVLFFDHSCSCVPLRHSLFFACEYLLHVILLCLVTSSPSLPLP